MPRHPSRPSPDLELTTGRYFSDSKPKASSDCSYDEAVAAQLWRISGDLVGEGTQS
jgi:hypothetical protein